MPLQLLLILLSGFVENIKLNKYTMTKSITTSVAKAYESPLCDIVEIKAEGVLCASMQQLEEVEGEYEW